MLLTSSQASILITSGIVLLCTSALFISGCLIQQRTLRDLRSAIRPAVVTRPKPRVWDASASASRRRTRTTIRLDDGTLVEIQGSEAEPAGGDPSSARAEDGPDAVEVRLTVSDTEEDSTAQKEPAGDDGADDRPAPDDGDDDAKPSSSSSSSSWDGVQEGGEALSRAERRKRIKAEIQRLSHGDTPVYYQRRLW